MASVQELPGSSVYAPDCEQVVALSKRKSPPWIEAAESKLRAALPMLASVRLCGSSVASSDPTAVAVLKAICVGSVPKGSSCTEA